MWNSKKICIIAIVAALCVGSNYALVGVPNVKVMDLLVFVTGYVFGPLVGAFVGIFAWFVYGLINPYGFVFQIWLATMFSEAIYGVAGGLISKRLTSTGFTGNILEASFSFGAAGFLLTFFYDLITNVVYALAFNVPMLVAIIAGVPFALVHEVSNAVLFGVCSVPLVTTLEKFVGGESFWRRQKICGS
ncbi:MAG: ECF transporter S component [Nitrososphaerota archaeon]|nr:ECF transporter S component [Candidatus Bathyarchaeota archaeon]MDW8023684.1 ECF transporter S component [Nitrososphaerota archaeon]